MKPARIIVLVIAVAAGGAAALLAGRSDNEAPAPVAVKVDTVDVLVAKTDIAMGQTVTSEELQWQAWPASVANDNFIRRTVRADAREQLVGSLARSPFVVGEPIREAKLVKATGSGFMAAVLPAGMRAISTEISAETGAGGFILPNDRVDVILTRRDRDSERRPSAESHTSETILTSIRVLAIDQTIEEKGGQKVVVGKTATLEVTALQAETLALSRQLGTLSLALRSLADASRTTSDPEAESRRTRSELNMVRFGVPQTVNQK